MRTKFQTDKYRKARGGSSRWLLISCERCDNKLAVYQKDGPGILMRMYIDRIIAPKTSASKNLVCAQCKTVIGVPIIFKKENRPALRLFAGAVNKKIVKSSDLDEVIKGVS